ncbi:hypothetical protein H6761_00885 [Candidatus Nomurabacteria bacterium]|nr:hypothetical protein [Candidatus Nomurabacteria bacterium]
MLNTNHPLSLKLIKSCPICSNVYEQTKIQILEESEYGILTYVTCQNCGANLLTKISTLAQGLVGQAILTDLKASEVMDFAVGNDLEADQVLKMQEMIHQNQLINNFREII